MTLATYQGVTWRVAARRHWPIPFLELETPSGGRCAAPSSQVEIHEVRDCGPDETVWSIRRLELRDFWGRI